MDMDPLNNSVREYLDTHYPVPPKRGTPCSPIGPVSIIIQGSPVSIPSTPPPRLQLENFDFGTPPMVDDHFLDDACLEESRFDNIDESYFQ